MSDHQNLEQAIVENPDDKTLRLVYADWLEERGDHRADFIRIMEEMNGLPVHSDRFWELRPQRNELWEQIDPNWIDKLGYTPTYRPMFTKIPERRVERWRLVEEFIDLWHKPLQPGDGYSDEELNEVEQQLGFRFPTALREWYQLCGKRKDVWCNQNSIRSPDDILRNEKSTDRWANRFRENRVIVFIENQGNELWGIRKDDLSRDDPPVFTFLQDTREVSSELSVFAVQALLYESIFTAPVSGWGDYGVREELLGQVIQTLTLSGLPQSYPYDDSRIYEGVDLICFICNTEQIDISARNRTVFEELSEEFRRNLEWTNLT